MKINNNGISREMTDSEKQMFFVEQNASEKRKEYEALAIEYIREKYTINEEAKVIREYLATGNKAAFDEYHTYVENCKATAKAMVYRGTDTK